MEGQIQLRDQKWQESPSEAQLQAGLFIPSAIWRWIPLEAASRGGG